MKKKNVPSLAKPMTPISRVAASVAPSLPQLQAAVPTSGQETTALAVVSPMSVLKGAVDSGASVEVLERLLALQERWEANQARKAFDAALSACRGSLPTILKRSEVDFTTSKGRTHYRYEDLASVTEAVAPVMAQHGLSFRWQTDSTQPGAISVTCIVSHEDGHAERTTLSAAADQSGNKNDIQAIGSAVTYLQRYTLKAALGIAAAVDDDGQARASRPPAKKPPEVIEHPPASRQTGTGTDGREQDPITEPQRKRLFAILKSAGRTDAELKAWLAVGLNIDSTKKITRGQYDGVIQAIETPGPLGAPADRELEYEREPGSDDE